MWMPKETNKPFLHDVMYWHLLLCSSICNYVTYNDQTFLVSNLLGHCVKGRCGAVQIKRTASVPAPVALES